MYRRERVAEVIMLSRPRGKVSKIAWWVGAKSKHCSGGFEDGAVEKERMGLEDAEMVECPECR